MKVLEYNEVITPTVGQGHLDTPILRLPESRSAPEIASCWSVDTSTTSSMNDLPASHSVVSGSSGQVYVLQPHRSSLRRKLHLRQQQLVDLAEEAR